ncbi:MAG: aryl-sulfate sulfotransferase [Rhodobacteraceae bacterium]|nr:aryl-sulfate sulfotransferase [Paracoccaceae bacterium]
MERILDLKIALWAVILMAVLGIIAVVAFGAAVLDGERGTKRFGAVAEAAVAVAEIPDTVKRMLGPDERLTIYKSERYDDKPTGWTLPAGKPWGLSGYILMSRYDGTRQHHVVELLSLEDWEVAYRWLPDGGELLHDAARTSAFADYGNWNSQYFRAIHPVLEPNGDLIVKDHFSPLVRVDACGRRVWINDSQMFHHSTEVDADGNLWLPSLAEPHTIRRVRDDFFEDKVTEVSPDGTVLFEKSVAQMLLDSGRDWMIFTNGEYRYDPMHLNDVEPALEDGPYWKKGDVFLSLRNISTIVQYRPSTDEVIWTKSGPWMAQHDVDILDDHRIAIYDNNAQMRGTGTFVEDSSEIMVYDFSTGQVASPLRNAMRENGIKTLFAGLFSALPGGFSLIEDVTEARFLLLSPDGKVAADFVNRAEDGRIYHLGWSRFVDKAFGDNVLTQIKKVNCNE